MHNRYPGVSTISNHCAQDGLSSRTTLHQRNVYPVNDSPSRRIHSPVTLRRLARTSSPSGLRANTLHRAASPANVALYLQRQMRPAIVVDVNNSEKADSENEGFSGSAIDLKRQHILQDNQKEASARLHDPAGISKSDGGMGTGWANPKPIVIDVNHTVGGSKQLPLDISTSTAGLSSLGDSHGGAIFRPVRSHSPSAAVRAMVVNPVTNKKQNLHRNNNASLAVRVVPMFASSKL